jgi:hypothetical protein
MLQMSVENLRQAAATTLLRGAITIKPKFLFLSFLLLLPVSASLGQDAGKLWPEIGPSQTGYLKVSPPPVFLAGRPASE